MFADQSIEIGLAGEDQVNFLIFSENLFRPDGSVRYFVNTGNAPNTFCSDTPLDSNPNSPTFGLPTGSGCVNPGNPAPPPPDKRVTCQNGDIGDIDRGPTYPGDPDICYNNALYTAAGSRPEGQIVVQGGKIDLSGLSVAIGMRFHW
jgi:hypothetical protein